MSKYIASDVLFDSEEEAKQVMCALADKHQGEFSYWRSQELAKKHETNEFKEYVIMGGVYEEIYELPEINIYKNRN